MLFNSLSFLAFFPVVFLLYFTLPVKWRNPLLLIANFWFYYTWKPVFVVLLLGVTLVTYAGGYMLTRTKNPKIKKRLMFGTVATLLLPLLFYKYLGFLSTTLNHILSFTDWAGQLPMAHLILPVGISFFTMQAIGYVMDVYSGDTKPESLYYTALFLTFFPQLNAGPIGRSTELIPQFKVQHDPDYTQLITGLAFILQGWFKKAMVADNIAPYVNAVFGNAEMHSGKSIVMASVLFAIQLYADFSGYSDMAVGCAKTLGFDLIVNFRRPLLATNMRFFWARWHVSLTTWFRDYLFAPMYLRARGKNRRVHWLTLIWLNVLVFAISGLWHGAGWTFIIWGILNGLYLGLEPHLLRHLTFLDSWQARHRFNNTIGIVLRVMACFALYTFSVVFFKADSIATVGTLFQRIFTSFNGPLFKGSAGLYPIVFPIVLLLVWDLYNEIKQQDVLCLGQSSLWKSALFFAVVTTGILLFGVLGGGQFIYFAF